MIQKKKKDRKDQFILLEHTLTVLYIPNKAVRNFLNQSIEKNELLYHRMYDGTMTDN